MPDNTMILVLGGLAAAVAVGYSSMKKPAATAKPNTTPVAGVVSLGNAVTWDSRTGKVIASTTNGKTKLLGTAKTLAAAQALVAAHPAGNPVTPGTSPSPFQPGWKPPVTTTKPPVTTKPPTGTTQQAAVNLGDYGAPGWLWDPNNRAILPIGIAAPSIGTASTAAEAGRKAAAWIAAQQGQQPVNPSNPATVTRVRYRGKDLDNGWAQNGWDLSDGGWEPDGAPYPIVQAPSDGGDSGDGNQPPYQPPGGDIDTTPPPVAPPDTTPSVYQTGSYGRDNGDGTTTEIRQYSDGHEEEGDTWEIPPPEVHEVNNWDNGDGTYSIEYSDGTVETYNF